MRDPTLSYRFDILTLFPGLFDGFLQESLIGKAIAAQRLQIELHDWRRFAQNKHKRVDDAPFGGGAGMVLEPVSVVAQLEALPQPEPGQPRSRRVLLSPAGSRFDQRCAERFAAEPRGLVLLCGRYEGFDARVEDEVDELLSLGDYVLNGGEVAAMVVIEAVARLLPGVIGNQASLGEESHTSGLLEAPQYTRPRSFRGREVPPLVMGGDHAKVAAWRQAAAIERTRVRRPDLYQRWLEVQPPAPAPKRRRRKADASDGAAAAPAAVPPATTTPAPDLAADREST